jgi:hypothetical protein
MSWRVVFAVPFALRFFHGFASRHVLPASCLFHSKRYAIEKEGQRDKEGVVLDGGNGARRLIRGKDHACCRSNYRGSGVKYALSNLERLLICTCRPP